MMSHWLSCLRDSLDSAVNDVTGRIAGDIANAGLATAIILSPLAAITFGENLLASSAMSVWSSIVLWKKTQIRQWIESHNAGRQRHLIRNVKVTSCGTSKSLYRRSQHDNFSMYSHYTSKNYRIVACICLRDVL